MKRLRVILPLLLVAAAGGALLLGRGEPFYLGGIQVNEPDHRHWLDTLKRSGLNTVAVTVYAHQGDWDSDNLWWDATDESVIDETRLARQRGLAVVLVLRVALDHAFPRNAFLWHGMIMPADDELLAAWFARYRSFVAQWAAIAAREGIDVLAVGSELNALASTPPVAELPALEDYYLDDEKQADHRATTLAAAGALPAGTRFEVRGQEGFDSLEAYLDAEIAANRAWAAAVTYRGDPDPIARINARRQHLLREWRGLVAAVRAVYHGRLTYAANFDQYRAVGFWDDLDLIGINAYFKLRERWQPAGDPARLYPDLVAGWRRVLGEIDDFRRSRGLGDRPVLFTELGYTRRANSTLQPWAPNGIAAFPATSGGEKVVLFDHEPTSRGERALAVRALREVELELPRPLLRGILYWKLTTQPRHAAIEPFALVLQPGSTDPLLPELLRFRRWRAGERLLRRVERAWGGPTEGTRAATSTEVSKANLTTAPRGDPAARSAGRGGPVPRRSTGHRTPAGPTSPRPPTRRSAVSG